LHFDCGDGVVVKVGDPGVPVDDRRADPTRAIVEGQALQSLAQRLRPGDVPAVLFFDPPAYLLGIKAASPASMKWSAALMRGEFHPGIAESIGGLLGRIHRLAWDDSELAAQFESLTLFRTLRLEPYHAQAAEAAEARGEYEVAQRLRGGAAKMQEARTTLVHGDFRPKNILIHEGRPMLIDFEVAHWGNPDFDTAFMLTQLVLHAIYRPQDVRIYAETARRFLRTYADIVEMRPDFEIELGALQQAGCLLIARADGKAPARYLTAAGRTVARGLGRAILRGEITQLPELFERFG
jgi:5-methylthioribose kinase